MPPAFTLSQDQTLHHFSPSLEKACSGSCLRLSTGPLSFPSHSSASPKLLPNLSVRLPHQRRALRLPPPSLPSTPPSLFFQGFFKLRRKELERRWMHEIMRESPGLIPSPNQARAGPQPSLISERTSRMLSPSIPCPAGSAREEAEERGETPGQATPSRALKGRTEISGLRRSKTANTPCFSASADANLD